MAVVFNVLRTSVEQRGWCKGDDFDWCFIGDDGALFYSGTIAQRKPQKDWLEISAERDLGFTGRYWRTREERRHERHEMRATLDGNLLC